MNFKTILLLTMIMFITLSIKAKTMMQENFANNNLKDGGKKETKIRDEDDFISSFPFTENFDSSLEFNDYWTIRNSNNDDYVWQVIAGNRAHSAPNYAKIRYNAIMPTDDWLISPGFLLEANSSYQIDFYYRANIHSFTEKISLYVSDNIDEFNNLLFENTQINNTDYEQAISTFTPTEDGVYYFAWHGHSDEDQAALLIDDISISLLEENISYNFSDITRENSVNIGENISFSANLTNNGNINSTNLTVECILNYTILDTIIIENLDISQTEEINYTHTATSPNGMNYFKFQISDNDNNIIAETSTNFEIIDSSLPASENPVFSNDEGITDSFSLTLSCPNENANIYFTSDGSDPNIDSQLYQNPIVISENITIKAIAIELGYPHSDIVTKSYIIENLLELPFQTNFPENMTFTDNWQTYYGILNQNTQLTPDWAAWIISNYQNQNNDNYAAETIFSGNNTNFWLVTPAFTADTEESFSIRFKMALTEFANSNQTQLEENQRFCILISNDNNWDENDIIYSLDNNDTITNNEEISIEIPQSLNNFKIAFYAESNDPSISQIKKLFIDDFRIEYSNTQYSEIVNTQINLDDDDIQITWDKPSMNKITKIYPTDDMYTDEGNPEHLEAQLMVGNQQNCNYTGRIMVKFDLSNISTEKFVSAEFNAKQFYAPGCIPSTPISIYAITEDWNENNWEHNTHISHSEQVFSSILYNENGWHSDDITSLVQAWLNEDIPNYGFVMVAENACAVAKLFSKDSSDSNNFPYLKVTESQTSQNRSIADINGYNIIRNGEIINFINNENSTEFTDNDLQPGTYNYTIQTVYNNYTTTGINLPEQTILAPPQINININNITVNVATNSNEEAVFEISNTGERNLSWSISESSERNRPVGDVITSWDVPSQVSLPWGLGFDKETETIWLSDVMQANGEANQLTEVSLTGEFIREIECSWISLWIADMVVSNDYIYAMMVANSGNEQIQKINKQTGELVATISGEWSENVTHAIALDEANNEFYLGGWWQDYIYHVDGDGNTINTFSTENTPNIAGLAWNPGGNNGEGSLWATGTNPYMIYEINPNNGEIMQSFPTIDNLAMYGLETGEDGSLWMVNLSENKVYNIDSGTSIEEIMWLNTNPANGVIEGGESQTVTLNFNTQELEKGTYSAFIKINNNASTEDIIIPITMNVKENDIINETNNANKTYLSGNYPNPFNPQTIINFSVKKNEKAELSIYNIKGQLVKSYKKFKEGEHKIIWEGKDNQGKSLSSGVYFYKLKSQSYSNIKRMILMK